MPCPSPPSLTVSSCRHDLRPTTVTTGERRDLSLYRWQSLFVVSVSSDFFGCAASWSHHSGNNLADPFADKLPPPLPSFTARALGLLVRTTLPPGFRRGRPRGCPGEFITCRITECLEAGTFNPDIDVLFGTNTGDGATFVYYIPVSDEPRRQPARGVGLPPSLSLSQRGGKGLETLAVE